jgi:TolB-like protein/Tfp pilus assembly protein PilF
MNLFTELKRRNVFKVAAAYLVISWVAVQIADTAFPAFGAPDWALRIFILVLLLGFPIALVVAWALELTPQGLRRDPGGNLQVYSLAAILIGLSLFWYLRDEPADRAQGLETPRTATAAQSTEFVQNASIAVLPFENMSNDPVNEPFTTGIHDDLLTKISQISSIHTISRTSVLQFKDSDKTVPEIASQLGVSTVLEGGIQRVGDSVRINVQLIDATRDEHLWAETYDRDLSAANIFAIQSEIATAIAGALKAKLTPDDQRRLKVTPTDNLEALEAYFEGKLLADERSLTSLQASIRKFEKAISIDPDFALAHSGLAYAWVLLPEYSASIDRELTKQNSVQAYTRALELDPDLPEGLTYKAWSEMVHRYDWASAEALLRKALAVQANNTDALHWLSHVLSFQGHHAEAIEAAERAVEADPFSSLMNMNLSYILMDDRQYDRSLQMREASLVLRADNSEVWRNWWLTATRAGRWKEATEGLVNWASGTGRDIHLARQLGELLQNRPPAGDMIEVPRDMLDRLEIGTENLAQVYAAALDGETTLAELRIALDERAGSRSVLSMKINPLYDFIRDDPRFIEMLHEIGLEN